jgi:hypothetical protein
VRPTLQEVSCYPQRPGHGRQGRARKDLQIGRYSQSVTVADPAIAGMYPFRTRSCDAHRGLAVAPSSPLQ